MRDWQLTANDPLAMRFAADTRLITTDYADDQSWEVVFGGPQEPALAFQTRYGGRAGIARLVPIFVIGEQSIYEGNALSSQPTLRAFAPNYARITAGLLPTLSVTAELWVMESHAVGGRFTLHNSAAQPVTLRLDLFAQLMRDDAEVKLNLLGLEDNSQALHLGQIGNLNPALLLENAIKITAGDHISPKLATTITLPAGGDMAIRWVAAAYPDLNTSLQVAYQWLHKTDWDAAFRQIEQVNAGLPVIETGNAEWDAAIAFSQQIALRSMVGPTKSLPHPSLVSVRTPARGWSPHRDGSDHGWQWNGQTAALCYLLAPSLAILAPDWAKGLINNALSTQKADGWIDFKPGLAGQRANLLSAPLLAATAWRVYELTEDQVWLAQVFPGLARFFERWFQKDMDQDGDGLPEWTDTTQSGYESNPTFSRFQRWAQNADINKAESPDLAAYLINEGHSLLLMADVLNRADVHPIDIVLIEQRINKRLDTLKTQLDTMCQADGSYHYRDRDTHHTPSGTTLFRSKGDEAFDTRTPLDPANRLILRIIGGKDHPPRISAVIEGIDFNGQSVNESLPASAFAWHYGMGAAVSDHAYSVINYVKFEGVSRVYSTEIATLDLTGSNQTLLLPFWAVIGPDHVWEMAGDDHADTLIKTITDPARYWRRFGMPVYPANATGFSADNSTGSGGVWLIWNTMILEGLHYRGYTDEARTLFTRLMDAQIKALHRDRGFREAYNSETGDGIGDLDEVSGIVPLGVLMALLGLRIINVRRVCVDGHFVFSAPIKVTQYGVEVTRSAEGTSVRFPSGYTAHTQEIWQVIEDPTPAQPIANATPAPASETAVVPITPPLSAVPTDPPTTIITVEGHRDATQEIPITRIDPVPPTSPANPRTDTPAEPPKQSNTPGTIKIPVRDDKK